MSAEKNLNSTASLPCPNCNSLIKVSINDLLSNQPVICGSCKTNVSIADSKKDNSITHLEHLYKVAEKKNNS